MKEKEFEFYCSNCEAKRSVNFSLCENSKTGNKYTDIVCKECFYIVATFNGQIIPDVTETQRLQYVLSPNKEYEVQK